MSVAPLRVIPPPSAVTSLGTATEPNSIFLSSTVSVVELIVVVVPLTVRSPDNTSDVPVAAPMFGVMSVGVFARTTAPVPATAVIAVPLIEKLLPVPAVLKVLLVKVSVVALPTRVSVASGRVIVLSTVCAAFKYVVVAVVAPATPKASCLVPSVPFSTTTYFPVPFGARCKLMFVSVPVAET